MLGFEIELGSTIAIFMPGCSCAQQANNCVLLLE